MAAPHPAPPHQPWLWLQACQETWWAGQDPAGWGRWFQTRRLQALLARARRDSPLYAQRARHARVLADIEPITKAELMRHFDDWATDRAITLQAAEQRLAQPDAVADAWLGQYLPWTSSGTSGQPGIFVQDAASLAAFDAIEALRFRGAAQPAWLAPWSTPAMVPAAWPGAGQRLAYVGAIGGPYAGHVSLRRLMRLLPPLLAPQLSLLSVLQPIADLAEQLQALQPSVLITYPSCATALADSQRAGLLQLRLDELWLGGEQLSAAQRQTLQTSFGCRVRNSYGASECFSIAIECAQGQLHLNSDWVILEGLDAQGRPVQPGELSHTTLLTNLANPSQPLLRYTLSDRVRHMDGACACGNRLPVIEVHGRADHVLALPALDGRQVSLLPLAVETVLEEQAQVAQFQLLMRPDGVLELRFPADQDSSHAAAQPQAGADAEAAFARCRQALNRWFTQQGLKPVHLALGRQAPQMQPGSGKLRRVIDLRSDGVSGLVG